MYKIFNLMENKMAETTIDAEAAAAIDVNGDGHI